MSPADETWVEIGLIVRPHGVQGELRLKLYNPDSEVVFGRDEFRLTHADGAVQQVKVTSARPSAAGFALIWIESVDDRDTAEQMQGAVLSVPRSALPPPDEDEFYVADVMGAEVVLTDGTLLGKVVDYRSYPTTDVIVVSGAGKTYEVPLVDDFVQRVDIEAKRVVLHSVEGLESP